MAAGSPLHLRSLAPADKQWLRRRLEDRTLSAYVLDRYRIIQAVLDGHSPTEIARILRCERRTVYHWVGVFNESGFRDFEKLNNPFGRPAILTRESLEALLEMARTDPRRLGLPFSNWSVPKLTEYCRARGIIPPVTQEWIRRLLLKEGIQFERGRLPWFRPGRRE